MSVEIERAARLPPHTPPTSSGSVQLRGEHVRSADGNLGQHADPPVGGGEDAPVGASTAVGGAEVPVVCAGSGPRRTSVEWPPVPAVAELVPEDGGRDPC